MKKTNVMVIGGSASGIVAATTGKMFYPDKEFLLVRKEKQVVVPCGIPYIFGSLKSSNQDVISDAVLEDNQIDIKVDEIVNIDQESNCCKSADGTEIKYEKLVLALGSIPTIPKWLKGADLENVFTIPKNKEYLDVIVEKLKSCQNVVIVGGGFIGVEVADEMNKINKDVTIIEIMPHVLELAFDEV